MNPIKILLGGCKWHKGEEQTDSGLGCQDCGRLIETKQCDACGRIFIDWTYHGCDDIVSGAYVTASGDLFCIPCGKENDRLDEIYDDGWRDDEYEDDDSPTSEELDDAYIEDYGDM